MVPSVEVGSNLFFFFFLIKEILYIFVGLLLPWLETVLSLHLVIELLAVACQS